MNNVIMSLKNVSKTYGLNGVKVEALKDANLRMHEGEVALLMGPSGAGKTTLLSVMGLLLHPTEGKINFENTTYNQKTKHKLMTQARRNSIGFIFQSFNLVKSLSVLQNVELMCKIGKINKNGYKKKCEEILKMLQMGHRLNHLPKELSGGERQRVAIARALINDPKMIFADEPTGNLDSENGEIIGNYFREIADERATTILIATHDDRLIESTCCDRIIKMEDGEILN
ncbi:MAG: ATP-binding cassette domain-containing protein [Candidatus Lokiarchaeota archaeon]|nr:ATP-binding cassette domain-containing protein [Candidatus Lokiarchaeota archaeon]MBD3340101.1 ATP-binding cassette domain-containing protein [Candidatus Lokiarchaeota archaeon]